MLPVIKIGFINLMVFPFVLLIAIEACFLALVYIEQIEYPELINMVKMFLPCLIFACIGGKTLYLFTKVIQGHKKILNLFNGFVFYGGLIGALVGISLFCKKHQIDNRWKYIDLFVSVLPLGQSIGRIGCYFNGCCYGKNYNGFLAVRYIVANQKCDVFPTWFVEAIFCLMIYIFMHYVNKKIYGLKTAVYMISYSFFRFIIEFYRGDEIRGIYRGISTSQIISVFVFLFGGLIMIRTKIIRKRGYREW